MIGLTASFVVKIDVAPIKKINWRILGGGAIYACICHDDGQCTMAFSSRAHIIGQLGHYHLFNTQRDPDTASKKSCTK